MILRTLDRKPINRTRTVHTKECEICGGRTREGKPFCPHHVEHHNYVRNILQILEDQAEEHSNVLTKGVTAIGSNSLTVKEIVRLLSIRGTTTINRIAKDMSLDLKVVEVYVKYLVRRRIARSGETKRGAKTLRLRKKTDD